MGGVDRALSQFRFAFGDFWLFFDAHGMKEWVLIRTDLESMSGPGFWAPRPMDGQRTIVSPVRGRTTFKGGKGIRDFRTRCGASPISLNTPPIRIPTEVFPVLPLHPGGAGFLFLVKGSQPKRRRGDTPGRHLSIGRRK